jgi:hypothetical protein
MDIGYVVGRFVSDWYICLKQTYLQTQDKANKKRECYTENDAQPSSCTAGSSR